MALLFTMVCAAIYLLLQSSKVQTYVSNILTEKISEKLGTKITIGKVNYIFFDRVILSDLLVEDRHSDTLFYAEIITANIDSLNWHKRRIALGELTFLENRIKIGRDSLGQFNFSFRPDSLTTVIKDTAASKTWNISCRNFSFEDSEIDFSFENADSTKCYSINRFRLGLSDIRQTADSTVFRIEKMVLNYNDRFNINRMNASCTLLPGQIIIRDVNLESDRSQINGLNFSIGTAGDTSKIGVESNFNISLDKSVINLAEIAGFIPSWDGVDEELELSGRFYGNLDDLKGKDITLRTGKNTNVLLDFYLNGVRNPETMYLFVDLNRFETTVSDIANFKLVKNGRIIKYQIPDELYKSGLLSFKGNFSGFLSDFVTFGTLNSNYGIIKADLSVIPKTKGMISYKGKIATSNFDLGKMINREYFGKLTFSGEANGDYNIRTENISGLFKGEIAGIEAHGYNYRNVHLDGYYKDKMFDGMISMNDSNLQFSFLGRMDINNETPEYDFNLMVDKVLPANLHLGENLPKSELAFNMKARFTGNKIDNLRGVIVIDHGYYKNKNGSLPLNNIKLISLPTQSAMELIFNSEYFDINVNGNYQFRDLVYSVKKSMDRFIPSLKLTTPPGYKPNSFDYRISVKQLDDITAVFTPGLVFETPFFVYGKMDSKHSDFQLEGSIPSFSFKNLSFRNIFFSNKTIDNEYVSNLKIQEINHKQGATIHHFAVNSIISNNNLYNNIEWYATRDSSGYSSIVSNSAFETFPSTAFPKIKSTFFPSSVVLMGKNWKIDPFTATVDSSLVSIKNFRLFNNDQNLEIDGEISRDSARYLSLNFKNINLASLKGDPANSDVSGILNGSVNISKLFNNPVLIADAGISGFKFKNQLIGDVVLRSKWDQINTEIDSRLEIVKNNKRSLLLNGSYNPETSKLNYMIKADSLPLKLLETVIDESILNNFNGAVSGQIRLGGTPGKILMNGSAKIAGGSLMIDYTKTKYFIEDSVYFKTDTIQFRNITVKDIHKNSGRLNGMLVHDNFRNMLYDFELVSPKLRIFNTTIKANEQFYGDVIANCKMKFSGRGDKLRLTGSLTTLEGTVANISMEYSDELAMYDFLEFTGNWQSDVNNPYLKTQSQTDFTIGLNIEVTPEAKVQLVYNSQVGDIIKGEGEGIMLLEMDKYGDLSLSGDYTVTKGDYLFTLQSVMSKRFTIAPGGTIVWSGDPYNAIINVKAIYKVKTTLSDLLANTYGNVNYLYQRIPVECIIKLTDELINPTIKFDINFPDENQSVKNELQQFFNTEEEINKQILSLIILGKFYTPEYLRGQFQNNSPNMVGTTASELFSNQLSNWLSQISNNVDVGFKYRPGNSITNDELELALSTQIFNDRVMLNGNVANNVNPESNSSSQIVGDFDMRVKLTRNGKIQFKAFNHANNDLIYETAPYTQGVGFSFKEEYNSFGELIKKITRVFRKKEQPKPVTNEQSSSL